MNLLCPNCQKMLTVPEEFAGQLMKCPLCSGTFTVPGLPGSAPPAPPPPSPEQDFFTIRQDPVPPPSPPFTPPLSNREVPPSTATTSTPPSPPPPAPSLPPEDYQHSLNVWFSPRVLPWIAPVCLLLVFFLQFFDWDGLYPGGVPAITGNAWTTAFGAYSSDPDMKEPFLRWLDNDKYKPGVNVLTIFYLLLFFPVLAATIASVVLDFLPIKVPPAVAKFLPWRWGIVAAANIILFLFLALQLLVGFSLDTSYTQAAEKEMTSEKTKTTPQQKTEAALRGAALQQIHHTFALKLAVLLHLVAIVAALLMFWVHQRGTHRPLPNLVMRW